VVFDNQPGTRTRMPYYDQDTISEFAAAQGPPDLAVPGDTRMIPLATRRTRTKTADFLRDPHLGLLART